MPAKLEYLARPTTLYRYRSFQGPPNKLELELRALETGYIWGASFDSLNDPMEGEFQHSRSLGLVGAGADYVRRVKKEITKVGIAAFCEVPNHALMWAHYADQYRGICVSYNFSKLRQYMDDDVVFTRVAYVDRTAKLSRVRDDEDMVARRILARKTRTWVYEREWRMLSSGTGKQDYSHECVVRVVLGHKMPDEWRRKVEQRVAGIGRIKISRLDPQKLNTSF